MSVPFKFRYLREVVGVFVLGAVATLLIAVVFVARGRHWFEDHFELFAALEEKTTQVIRPGMTVQIGSTEVGRVVDTKLGEDEKVLMRLRIRETFHNVLTLDSEAVLHTPIIDMPGGRTYLEIIPGKSSTRCAAGATIRARKGDDIRDILKLAKTVFLDLRRDFKPIAVQFRALVEQSSVLIEQINKNRLGDKTGEFMDEFIKIARDVNRKETVKDLLSSSQRLLSGGQRTLVKAEKALDALQGILARIEQGKGLVGQALQDEKMYARIASTLERVHGALDTTERILASADQATGQLPRIATAGAAAAEDMAVVSRELRYLAPRIPEILRALDEVLFESRVLIDAVERHWMLRRYVAPAKTELLVPTGILDATNGRTAVPATRKSPPSGGKPPAGATPNQAE